MKSLLSKFLLNNSLLKNKHDEYAKLRGARYVQTSEKHKQNIRNTIESIQCDKYEDSFKIPGTSHHLESQSIHQFLYKNLCNKKLFNSINLHLGSKGRCKISTPLPKQWRRVLEANGFQVNHLFSQFKLLKLSVFYFFAGLYDGLKLTLRVTNRKPKPYFKKTAYFHGLADLNFPNSSSSKDICTWCNQFIKKDMATEILAHNFLGRRSAIKVEDLKIVYSPRMFDVSFSSLKERLYFLSLFFVLSTKVFIGILFGRLSPAFMMRELVLYTRALTINPDNFYGSYYFHSSDYVYKPIWLNIAESKHTKVFLYYYSANIANIREDEFGEMAFNLLSWANYLVWNFGQKRFLEERILHKSEIDNVNPIFFSDNSLKKIPVIDPKKKTIAVFDIAPMRKSYKAEIGSYIKYYTFDTIKQFYIDIINLADSMGFQVICKSKRATGNKHHKGYISFLESLKKRDNWYVADPSINAERIISSCDFVISLPYTSTAILAKNLNIPSVYYHSPGELILQNRIQDDIALIQSYKALNDWLAQASASSNRAIL